MIKLARHLPKRIVAGSDDKHYLAIVAAAAVALAAFSLWALSHAL